MKAFQSITALIVALLIVNPFCCCAAEMVKSDELPSCCSAKSDANGHQDDHQPHICACKSKQPRTEAKELTLPTDVGALVEPVMFALELPLLVVSEVTGSAVPVESGSDPPRWMLARFSRWLI